MPRVTTLSLLDLYSGVGGWIEGLNRYRGGETHGIEIEPCAVQTSRTVGHMITAADVRTLDPRDFPTRRLVGGPPCQGFSISGAGAGRQDLERICHLIDVFATGAAPTAAEWNDVRSELTAEPMRWIYALRPEMVALEQVPQVLPIWQHYAARLRDLGYSTWTGNLSAERFGVPQTRRRAVLIANRTRAVSAPRATHSRHGHDDGLPAPVSMADALGRGFRARSQRSGNYANLTQRSNYAGSSANGTTAAERGRSLRRGTEPSVTITGRSPQWVRPDGTRVRFSPAECGVLQDFPADYPWYGERLEHMYQQIGNAIPPGLAAAALRAAEG